MPPERATRLDSTHPPGLADAGTGSNSVRSVRPPSGPANQSLLVEVVDRPPRRAVRVESVPSLPRCCVSVARFHRAKASTE